MKASAATPERVGSGLMVVVEQNFYFGGPDPERLDRSEAKLDAVLATITRTDEGVSGLMTIALDIADAVAKYGLGGDDVKGDVIEGVKG